jgi:hypothetical protein
VTDETGPTGPRLIPYFFDFAALVCFFGVEETIRAGKSWHEWLLELAVGIVFGIIGLRWVKLAAFCKEKLGSQSALLLSRSTKIIIGVVAAYVVATSFLYMRQLREELDVYVMPRKITAEQADQIRRTLAGHDPGIPIEVFASQADREAMEYASQIVFAIKAAGWNAVFESLNPWETGPSANHYNGAWFNINLAVDQGITVRVSGNPSIRLILVILALLPYYSRRFRKQIFQPVVGILRVVRTQ